MATTTTITKMLFRRGNNSDREKTILASGEPGWALDTKRLWIGDGVTPGGYPALSGADQHLHYTDASGQQGAGPQKLDINIHGLSASLVGDGEYNRSVHGTDRTINTDYPLQFSTISQTEPAIFYNGSPESEFYINRTNGGTINIGNALYVDVDDTGLGSVRFSTDSTTFEAAKLIFAEADTTVYEDKTLDLNVNVTNGSITAPGVGGTSEKTGLYLSHRNYLSAGHISVGHTGDDTGWSTIEIQPPVYENDWTNGETELLTRFDRTPQTTSSWTGGGISVGSGLNACKPLVLKSARPSQYSGNADLVFETGLIVYGEGATDIGGWNGYLINQSTDTGASPTFAGINIQNADGTPGDPMSVSSGGTGNSSYAAGGVLASHETDSDGPFRSLVLGPGELITGSNTGAKSTSFDSASWIDITSNATTGVISFANRMVPTAAFVDAATTQTEFFNKWYNVATNTGNLNPTTNHSAISFVGDSDSNGAGSSSEVNISTQNIAGNKIKINHKSHAQTLFTAHATSGQTLATVGGEGTLVESIQFNRAGHVTNITTNNPSSSFLSLDHVGTKPSRSGGSITAPNDYNLMTGRSASTPSLTSGVVENSATYHAKVVTGFDFNDYGTIKATHVYDLKDNYYNRHEVGNRFSGVQTQLNDLQTAIGNASFLKSNASSATTGASMTTSFNNKAKVAFSEGTTQRSYIQQTASGNMLINTGTHLQVKTDNAAGVVTIGSGSETSARFAGNSDSKLYHNNTWRIMTTNVGVSINSQCHATSFHGNGDNLDLSNNASIPKGNFVDVTGGTFTGHVRVDDSIYVLKQIITASRLTCSDISCAGTIECQGDIIAFASSDERLKDNLTPISSPLEKVSRLNGYEFDWNDKQNTYSGHDVGVVAQEVEQVMPEVVAARDDGYKAVKYEKLVPLLIESIKELTAKVEELESRLK